MNTKTRIVKLESVKPTVKITWKDFIDWTNGKVFDAVTEAKLQKEWGEFVASQDIGNDVQKELHGKG